jgi:hypothetical protein
MLFVPRIDHERGEIDMLRIYDEQDLTSLTNGTWGIPEPSLERNSQRRQSSEHVESISDRYTTS